MELLALLSEHAVFGIFAEQLPNCNYDKLAQSPGNKVPRVELLALQGDAHPDTVTVLNTDINHR